MSDWPQEKKENWMTRDLILTSERSYGNPEDKRTVKWRGKKSNFPFKNRPIEQLVSSTERERERSSMSQSAQRE